MRFVRVPLLVLAPVLALGISVLSVGATPVGDYPGLVSVADGGPGPLVADAGDSAFVAPDDYATFIGQGYGGVEPYRFEWSADGGELVLGSEPHAQVRTDGMEPGRYSATLTITDAEGTAATDDVVFVVSGGGEATELLNETKPDPEPGVLGGGGSPGLDFPVDVPEGIARIEVDLTWTNVANDYDLEVLDPDGEVVASSGNAPPAFESTGVADPEPGTWTVRAFRYATATDPGVSAVVRGFDEVVDGRPAVQAGGPYAFVTGDDQQLEGEVTVPGGGDVTVGWDTNLDGVVDADGAAPVVDLPAGRHLVVLHAKAADGLERQQMTSVLVGTEEQIDDFAVPLTVIGLADSGINPYHQELSAATYPDPRVLELTRNFTRHPSEYIPGYPEDAKAIPITLDQGYFPEQDEHLWRVNDLGDGTLAEEYVVPGELYWIPGTKIVGAIDAGGSTGATSGEDIHPVLDDNGHGTGSSTVSTGNRYGYCPTCLLVNIEALDESVAARYPWIDISSNSFGYIGGLPVGTVGLVTGLDQVTKAAAERGQTTLFAAGNGVGNAFDVPVVTYTSDQTGPDWNVTVGALREDNGEAVFGDGLPVHLSSLGDGNLPSACRVGTAAQCAFGGTSAATPYTAGVFGHVLTEIRQSLGDHSRPGQFLTADGEPDGQVVARGTAVPDSPYLSDGELTRRELRAAVLKTAVPLTTGFDPARYPYPATYRGERSRVAVEGYGAANPNNATRAIAVLLGDAPMPARDTEDAFFVNDCEARDDQYGSFDRDGDGEADGCDAHEAVDPYFDGEGDVSTDPAAPGVAAFDPAREVIDQPYGSTKPITYWLHRVNDQEPDLGTDQGCAENFNASFMDRQNSDGDNQPCFDSRVTSTVAAFRPKGIFAAADILTAPLPAGSTVEASLFVASDEPGATTVRGVLMGTDREVGRGEATALLPGGGATLCAQDPSTCYVEYGITFTTERPVAAGEQLTFQIQIDGTRAYSFGYEGDQASSVTITPAQMPESGLEFGVAVGLVDGAATAEAGGYVSTRQAGRPGQVVTGRVAFPALGADPQNAGFHPAIEAVRVSAGDPDFSDPVYAVINETAGTWTAVLPSDASGEVYAQALRDRFPSPVVTGDELGGGDPGGNDPGGPVGKVVRFGGPERTATAAAISAATFDTADTVVIARDRVYADALAGAPLAVDLTAPLLLSATQALSEATATEIQRLDATQAVLLGGTEALSEAVEDDLEALDLSVRRVGGLNRFDTARLIAEVLPPSDEVIVAEGEHADPTRGWPDALSASALAAVDRTPVLLVNRNRLPSETVAAMESDVTVTLIGGSAAISDDVAGQIDDTAGEVTRVFGPNRYATSAAVADLAISRGADPAITWVATGRDFADGLVAGAATGHDNAVLLLVDGQGLAGSPAAIDWLTTHRGDIAEVRIAGSTAAVSAAVETAIGGLLEGG